jgi:NAD(P)-dependent dehydrogenase (short-subunit alcohol dehydrogenase family)
MQVFNSDLLKGQVAIVTGGGTGIGRAIAEELAKAGSDIVVAARRKELLAKAAQEIHEQYGVKTKAIELNIRDHKSCEVMASEVYKDWGKIDILVNNAGGQFPIPSEKLSIKGWNAVVDLNLNGTYYCTRAVGEYMREQKHGRIINIGICSESKPIPGLLHSTAARTGVIGLTRAIAVEWGKYNITCNCVAPGTFMTPAAEEEMVEALGPQVKENFIRDVPLHRLGNLEEMGWVVTFLASSAAGYINGEFINVDGGITLGRGIAFADY